MLGTNIRSVRHLFRVSDTSLKTVLIKFDKGSWEICKVIKFPQESVFKDSIFIFNNIFNHSSWDISTLVNSKDFGKKHNLSYYGRVLEIKNNDFYHYAHIFKEIILLEDNFDENYEKFLQDNAKIIKSLRNSIGINTNDVKVKMMYVFSEGSKNFFNWAVTTYYKNGIALSVIRNILCWNETYSQLSKNLSKGTITAYTSKNSILVLNNELSEIRKAKRINDSINSFNTAQKKMLKEHEMTDSVKQALWKLSRLSETKRLNFIKKMSSVTDYDEFIRQLKFVTSVHFAWNKESFLDYINNVEGIKFEKILETDKIVLVKVFDYETIKQLGKTTNWCISKNKKYWNDYIESHFGATSQYMVFDFSKIEDDKLSIIGFTTTKNKGITSAHNFINDNLMGNSTEENELTMLNSFIKRFKDTNNIYSILENDGIDITIVLEYDKPRYDWNKESVLSYLYECVDKANVEILKNYENKIAISVTDENIRYFFGDVYCDNMDSYYYSFQHLIFMDFNKSKYDNNKIQFAIIDENSECEEYCINLYNETCMCLPISNFDALLAEFGLPYNTIKRIDDPISKLRNAITSFNSLLMKESMTQCSSSDLLNVIKKMLGSDYYYDALIRSIKNHVSFDFLDLIYDNGLTLCDIMSSDYVGDLVKNISIGFSRNAVDIFEHMEGVTDVEISDFFNNNINRKEVVKYIGYYVAIKTILQHEKIQGKQCNDAFKSFVVNMMVSHGRTEIYEQIFNLIKDNFDYNHKHDTIYCIAQYACKYGSEEFKNFIFEKAKKNKALKEYIDEFEGKNSFPNFATYTVPIDILH